MPWSATNFVKQLRVSRMLLEVWGGAHQRTRALFAAAGITAERGSAGSAVTRRQFCWPGSALCRNRRARELASRAARLPLVTLAVARPLTPP